MNPLRVQDSIIVVFLLNVKNLHSFRMVFVDIHGKKKISSANPKEKTLYEVPSWISKLTPGTYQMASKSNNDVIFHIVPENYKVSSEIKSIDIGNKPLNKDIKSITLPNINAKISENDVSDPIVLDLSKSSLKEVPKVDPKKSVNKPIVFKLQSIDTKKEEKKDNVEIVNPDKENITELYPRENIEYYLGHCNPHHANGFERSFNPLLRINKKINYFKYKTLKNKLSFFIDAENNKQITDSRLIKSFEKPRGISNVISDRKIKLNPVKMRLNKIEQKKKKQYTIFKKIKIRFTYKKELHSVDIYPEDTVYNLKEKAAEILLMSMSRLDGYYNGVLISNIDEDKTLEEFFKLERQGNKIVNLENRNLEVDFVRKYRNSSLFSPVIKQYPYKIIIEDYPNVSNRDIQINVLLDDFFARTMMKRDCKIEPIQEKNGYSIAFNTISMAFDFNKFLDFFKKETFLLDNTKTSIEFGESVVLKKDTPAYSSTKNLNYYC